MKTLRELLGFCNHTWTTIKVDELVSSVNKTKVGYLYTLRCSKCGKIRIQRI